MKLYISRQIEFSPVYENKEEVVKACVKEMRRKGYRLDLQTQTGISRAVLVFKAA